MNLDQLPAGYTLDPDGVARRHGHPMGELPGLAHTAPPMAETEWQQVVVDYATLHGWWAWHDQDPRRNRAGLPDLLLIRERVIWAELKSERGKLRPAQRELVDRFAAAGVTVHVWRPSDWPEVQHTLGLG